MTHGEQPGEPRVIMVSNLMAILLQSLAARFYGSATEWQRLYEANRDVLGDDPNLPPPGTELLVPRN